MALAGAPAEDVFKNEGASARLLVVEIADFRRWQSLCSSGLESASLPSQASSRTSGESVLSCSHGSVFIQGSQVHAAEEQAGSSSSSRVHLGQPRYRFLRVVPDAPQES